MRNVKVNVNVNVSVNVNAKVNPCYNIASAITISVYTGNVLTNI